MEMLIVVAIIVILAGVGGAYMFGALVTARDGVAKSKIKTLEGQVQLFRTNRAAGGLLEEYPASLDMLLQADPDQIEQLLINLIKNAVEASLETGGGVLVGWQTSGSHIDIYVRDDGPGLSNTTNLFVPFFTTKPGGSGIGLVLSRQIAEAHGGSLSLDNREDATGCVATLRLRIGQK